MSQNETVPDATTAKVVPADVNQSTAVPAAVSVAEWLGAAWTGGQYSLVRAIVGLLLFLQFARLLPEAHRIAGPLAEWPIQTPLSVMPNVFAAAGSSSVAVGVLCLAMLLSALVAIGYGDRLAAVGVWYLWTALFARRPELAGPWPYANWILLAHFCVPPAPFGSWAARGRIDPGDPG